MSSTYRTEGIGEPWVRDHTGDTAERYGQTALETGRALSRLAAAIVGVRDAAADAAESGNDPTGEHADWRLAGGDLAPDSPMGELYALLGIAERAAYRLYGEAHSVYHQCTATDESDCDWTPGRWAANDDPCLCGAPMRGGLCSVPDCVVTS